MIEYALALDDIGDINDIEPAGPTSRTTLMVIMSEKDIPVCTLLHKEVVFLATSPQSKLAMISLLPQASSQVACLESREE